MEEVQNFTENDASMNKSAGASLLLNKFVRTGFGLACWKGIVTGKNHSELFE